MPDKNIHPWIERSEHFLGEHEIKGKADNQFILDCFKFTNYKAGHDEVPWCAAFVSRMLEETGYKSGHTAWAFAYEHVGQKCDLRPGAIVVFKWASGGGHVAFVHHVVGNYVYCIGGNQADSVKISAFNKRYVVATRWPDKA